MEKTATKPAAAPKAAAPKKSSGFTGIRAAFWVIVVCFIIAICIFKFVLGAPGNFEGGDPEGHPINLLGTIYKGGYVVPIIHTLLLTVIALSIERWLALRTAFGKGSLAKFTASIKEAIAKQDFAKAQQLCDKQRGSVANVVSASIRAYQDMERTTGVKKAQKVAKIQQAHEEATQLEMPTLVVAATPSLCQPVFLRPLSTRHSVS